MSTLDFSPNSCWAQCSSWYSTGERKPLSWAFWVSPWYSAIGRRSALPTREWTRFIRALAVVATSTKIACADAAALSRAARSTTVPR